MDSIFHHFKLKKNKNEILVYENEHNNKTQAVNTSHEITRRITIWGRL
jgi:hypothetical protein